MTIYKNKTNFKIMEEKNQSPKKLSYEELQKAAGDLHLQYQKLANEYQKAIQALNNREFDYMSFLLQMLFKVVEHPEMYKTEFVAWSTDTIQAALTSFAESIKPKEEAKNDEKAE